MRRKRGTGTGFKGMVERDIKNVFLNPLEFGEKHDIAGVEMTVLVDENELVQREKKYKNMAEGIHRKQLLVYVSAAEFGAPPPVGGMLELDGEYYEITDVADEDGIYSISLGGNEQ